MVAKGIWSLHKHPFIFTILFVAIFAMPVSAITFTNYSLPIGQAADTQLDFTKLYYSSINYNMISYFKVTDTANVYIFPQTSNSTTFTVVEGGTGSGYVQYNSISRTIEWFFTNPFLSNSTLDYLVLSYSSNIFENFAVNYGCYGYGACGFANKANLGITKPIALRHSYDANNVLIGGWTQAFYMTATVTNYTNYSGTNTIIFSNVTDYNSSISSRNINDSFYVTTWINDSLWSSDKSWWGWIVGTDFYITYIAPNGYTSTSLYIYNQNADQTLFNFSALGWLGNYTFMVKRFFSDQIIIQKNITIVNSSGGYVLPSIDDIYFSVPSGSNNSNPNIDVLTRSVGNNIDVKYQMWDNISGVYAEAEYPLVYCDDCSYLSLGTYITGTNYFNLKPVKIIAKLYDNTYTTLASDYIYFNSSTPPPTPPPTPLPTLPPTPLPTYSPTPTPTPTPTPYPTATESGEYCPTCNQTFNYNTSGNFGGLNSSLQSINSSLTSYDSATSKAILAEVVPSVLNVLPIKITAFVGFIIVLLIAESVIKAKKP